MEKQINQHQCRVCALKHLSSALVIGREILNGYDTDEYHLYLLGNLAEAQEQLTMLDVESANRVRFYRLELFGANARAALTPENLRRLEREVCRFAGTLRIEDLPRLETVARPISGSPISGSPRSASSGKCGCGNKKKVTSPISTPSEIPMFRKPDGTDAGLDGQSGGGAVFVVLSGPSVSEQDLTLLNRPGITILSVNNAPATLFRNNVTPHYWVSVDSPSNFLPAIFRNPAVVKLIPRSRMHNPLWDNERRHRLGITPADCPRTCGFDLSNRFNAAEFFTDFRVHWGDPPGENHIRTVFLAMLQCCWRLGFRRLYLIGADFAMSAGRKYHFEEERSTASIRHNNSLYQRLTGYYLPELCKVMPPEFKIFNCTPGSRLKLFPELTFAEAIDRETIPSAELATVGMYRSLKSKEEKSE